MKEKKNKLEEEIEKIKKTVAEAFGDAIMKTPSGEARNLLCDLNATVSHVLSNPTIFNCAV